MDERAINIKIPQDVWDMIDKLNAGRTLEGKPSMTKKVIVAAAIEAYCKKEGVKK